MATRELYLYGDIGSEVTASQVIAQIRREVKPTDTLNVRISSRGGDVFDGFTIANQVRAFKGRTIATVDGVAASMASIVAMAADEVHMAENAWMMIHEPRANMFGATAGDLDRAARQAENVRSRMATVYSEKTGLDRSEVERMMAAETWMDSNEAQQLGFSSETIPAVLDMAACADKFSSENFKRVPDFAKGGPMNKTRLGLLISAALPEDRDEAFAKIAEMSASTVSKIETIASGSSLLRPTTEEIAAFALVLDADEQQLVAAAKESWDEVKTPAEVVSKPTVSTVDTELAMKRGAQEERERVAALKAMFAGHGQDELLGVCIEKGRTPADAGQLLLSALSSQPSLPATPQGHTVFEMESREDKFRAAALMTIMAQGDPEYRTQHAADLQQNEFAGFTMAELARAALEARGVSTRGMDRFEMVGASFTTSDFPNILRDAAHKSLMGGFEEQSETWRQISRIGNLRDFKPNHRVTLSEYDDLLKITNGSEEYKRGEFSDLGEAIILDTWGRLFKITRQAVINDDASAFSEVPRRMGRAAGRKVGDIAWTLIWNGNPSHNEDSTATYHANHNNLVAVALDQTNLDTARSQMFRQPGPLAVKTSGRRGAANASGARHGLNIAPALLLVPTQLLGTAISMVTGEWMFQAGQALTGQPNIVRGIATPVSDARMDSSDLAGSNGWVLSTNPNGHPTLEMGFLDGNASPRLEQQTQFTTDGVDYKVSIDVGAQVLDWRGLYKSTGA